MTTGNAIAGGLVEDVRGGGPAASQLVGIVTDRHAVKALARQVPALRQLVAG
jgi:hypothetical protein